MLDLKATQEDVDSILARCQEQENPRRLNAIIVTALTKTLCNGLDISRISVAREKYLGSNDPLPLMRFMLPCVRGIFSSLFEKQEKILLLKENHGTSYFSMRTPEVAAHSALSALKYFFDSQYFEKPPSQFDGLLKEDVRFANPGIHELNNALMVSGNMKDVIFLIAGKDGLPRALRHILDLAQCSRDFNPEQQRVITEIVIQGKQDYPSGFFWRNIADLFESNMPKCLSQSILNGMRDVSNMYDISLEIFKEAEDSILRAGVLALHYLLDEMQEDREVKLISIETPKFEGIE